MKKTYQVLLLLVLPILFFWKSIFSFFTNDDFFFLRISNAKSIGDYFSYFNIFQSHDGLEMYRPLTTQVFYQIKNPLIMHLLVFLTFFGILYLIYIIGLSLFKNPKVAFLATVLYSVSATHFAHFYYLATYQELGMVLFVLLTILLHIKNRNTLSLVFFCLALMSKETAVVTPLLILLVDWYREVKIDKSKFFIYFGILVFYLIAHLFFYGVAKGDSYVWDFSIKKVLNTVFWYLLWSLNLPETLVDFIGPGFYVNPDLFRYWATTIYPILALFAIQLIFIAILMLRFLDKVNNKKNSLFAMVWFLLSLTPVVFLPIHKFAFYLTLPLIGVVYRIAYLIEQSKLRTIFIVLFLGIWATTSYLTIQHTINTSWITNGEEIASKVYVYFKMSGFDAKKISMVDTVADRDLPWSPTAVVKNALSDKNFFIVYFPNLADKIEYNGKSMDKINSRQFLGY